MEYVNLALFKSINGGSDYISIMSGIPNDGTEWGGTTDRVEFIAPFEMDPNNFQTLYAGTYKIYRTTNGGTNWQAVSGDLTGGQSTISTLAISKENSDVIYVGTANGRIQVTTDKGANWNLRNSNLPAAYCTRLVIDENNAAIAYATFSGFNSGNKIYKTTNYGVTWTNISGNLPNVPANCVFANPEIANNLVIGTDLGIFSTYDGGANWIADNKGLANVSVVDLDYRKSDRKLFASTHGRGMFVTDLSTLTNVEENLNSQLPKEFALQQNYPNPFNPTTTISFSIPENQNVELKVYDLLGNEVANLVNEYKSAGSYSVNFNASNLASGIYFYKLKAGNFQQTKKLILLK